MQKTERPKVPPLDEVARRWLQGRLDGQERALAQLRMRLDAVEQLLDLAHAPRPREPRAPAAPAPEAQPHEPGS